MDTQKRLEKALEQHMWLVAMLLLERIDQLETELWKNRYAQEPGKLLSLGASQSTLDWLMDEVDKRLAVMQKMKPDVADVGGA